MKYLKQNPFICFLIMHFLVWSLIPLLRRSLPMDSIEAVVWGNYCNWGTNKHPPLSGFLAYWAYFLGNGSHYALYALSQCCVVAGFIYIYKLACRFLEREKAVLSVMLLEGVIYYGFSALEFNVNVVSLALWPAAAYYFYKALDGGRAADWVLTGIFAGLNLLNKYTSLILLAAMFLLMVCDKTSRRRFKEAGPYFAALVCLAVVLPHIAWLYRHDFFVADYFLGRSSGAAFNDFPLLRHVVYPLKFFGAQVLFGLGTLLIYFIGTRHAEKLPRRESVFQCRFLYFMGLLPLVIMVLVSLAGGIKLKSMWGFPVLYLAGVMLFVFFPCRLGSTVRQKLFRGVYIIMALMAVAEICVIVFNKSDKLHLNAPEYAKSMALLWDEASGGRPLKYVAGDVWWADNVALYAPSKPKPVIWGDPAKNPWFDEDDIHASGALIVAAGAQEYKQAAENLGNASAPQTITVECRNPAGKIKRKTVYYGYHNLGKAE